MHDVVTIETAGLGDRSYLVHDGEHAAVIDPQRDIDRVLAVAEAAGVRITHVLETHIHNDYVTGGLALARGTGRRLPRGGGRGRRASAGCPPATGTGSARGRLTLTAMATPGHTPDHLSYVLRADEGAAGRRLHRRVAALRHRRTPRPGRPATDRALTRAQYASVRRLADDLPDDDGGVPHARLRQLLLRDAGRAGLHHDRAGEGANTALTRDEETFVNELLAGLDAFPAYYAHMGPANAAARPRRT